MAFTIFDRASRRSFRLLVDLADGSFGEDVEVIEQAEREAYRARYGRLEPALFERLETMRPDDEVPVAIWVAGEPKRSEEEPFAALVQVPRGHRLIWRRLNV